MNKVAHYLQEHLIGEVMVSPDARRYFSTDASIFSVTPAIIVYPRNENDVRKTARFCWQLAERGRSIPITPRGAGSDQSGAAIGPGVSMVFPAHLNRILEFDGKSGDVTVEPGINYGKLQQTLHTHNRFLPPYPASVEYSTVGGAVANNASGEKSVKYGSTREFVKSLRVVLANGEIVDVRRLSKRELNKKLGLASLEGEIYRNLDALIEENADLLKDFGPAVSRNSAGYNIGEVKRKDGSFDLTPLIVGSQGTLGIVTEITFQTEVHNPHTTLIVAQLDSLEIAEEVLSSLQKLPDAPSAVEMVDDQLLTFVQAHNPNQLKGVLEPPFAKIVMLIEFDNPSERQQKKLTKKLAKTLSKLQVAHEVVSDPTRIAELWKIRQSSATIAAHAEGNAKALPIVEDGIVPVDKFKEYITEIYTLFKKYNLQPAIWGHAGDANLHVQPFLDLSQVGDRQRVFRLIDEYYDMVIKLGGSTSGQHNDGRLRGPHLEKVYGPDIYDLFVRVKNIFDPFGILNTGVKINVRTEDIKPLIRQEYSLGHLYQHMPRS